MAEQEFYDFLGHARSRIPTEKEGYRVHRTLALLPANVRTAVDIASGDGRLSRHLLDTELVVQCDISSASLEAARGHRVQSDVGGLPFVDGSFDLAMCCEGLEHFPEDVFQRARKEIPRVSREHVLISVPFAEDLLANTTRCGACGHVFHKWGHVRRFTLSMLETLFPDCVLKKHEYFGRTQPFRLKVVQKINQKYGGAYAEPSALTICPSCGEQSFTPPKRNPTSRAMNAIERVAAGLVPTGEKHWVVALYARL